MNRVRSFGYRICIGCETEFLATGPNQKRCRPQCGYFRGPRAQGYRASRSHRIGGLDFVGVDGEGVTDVHGNHRYVLLSVGDKSLTTHEDDGRLGFHEIMPFLWECYLEQPHAAFVGFYLSYDFSQWFRDLPMERARYLFTEWGRYMRTPKGGVRVQPFPVRYGGWEFDFLGLRRFKLRPCPGDETADYSNTKESWLYICDSGPFWQTSLLTAIDPKNWGNEPVVTRDEWAVISEGKKQRSSAVLDKAMIRYNVTENAALSRAMGRLERGFAAQGWNLKRSHWFGPGQSAQMWLNNIKAPTGEMVREKTPDNVLFAAQASYYGGWFEIPRHGIVTGTTYEYDINSAYPHIISTLPCLLHGDWVRGTNSPVAHSEPVDSDLFTLCRADCFGSDTYLGGLPHRNREGIISRPNTVRGWYWLHEINAAVRAGLIDSFVVHESWTYVPCHCKPPLRSIADLYHERLNVGKNTAHGKALKLVYNSAYGKFAQSIGMPKYSNPIYASLITSGCRTMILDAIATHPAKSRAVLMVATDGVYFRTPHPALPISKDSLGYWDEDTKTNLTLFMPGVYWDDKSRKALRVGDAPHLKSRGINAAELGQQIDYIDSQFRELRKLREWPTATIPIRFSVVSPQLALSRGKWETCGSISTFEHTGLTKDLSSDPTNKRDVSRGLYWEDDILTTYPYVNRGDNWGYSKAFGMTLESIIDNDAYITDDGTITQEIIELLGGK